MLYKVSNKKTTSPLRGTPPQEENLARDGNKPNFSPGTTHEIYQFRGWYQAGIHCPAGTYLPLPRHFVPPLRWRRGINTGTLIKKCAEWRTHYFYHGGAQRRRMHFELWYLNFEKTPRGAFFIVVVDLSSNPVEPATGCPLAVPRRDRTKSFRDRVRVLGRYSKQV